MAIILLLILVPIGKRVRCFVSSYLEAQMEFKRHRGGEQAL
jgi:hypothetical protein